MSPANPSYRRASILSFITLFALIVFLTMKMVKPYVIAVLMGGIIAVLCRPLYLKVKGNTNKRKSASTLVTLLFLFCLIIPSALFIFMSVRQGISVVNNLANNESFSFAKIQEHVSHWPIVQQYIGDTAELERQTKEGVKSLAKFVPASVLGFLSNTPEFILQLALTFLSCFFFLIDGPRFIQWLSDKIPLDPVTREKISKSFRDTTISTILATLAAASAQATIMVFSYLVLGVPAAFLAGGATFVLAWIPMVGSMPVWTIGAIYLGVSGSITKAILMILFGFFTGIIDNFIRPLVLKGRNEMHPLVSLVAIFGGIHMFGILGVFIGPVVAAILISFIDLVPEVTQRLGRD